MVMIALACVDFNAWLLFLLHQHQRTWLAVCRCRQIHIMSHPPSPRRSPTNSANIAMFRSNSTSVVRLDSTLSGTYTATAAPAGGGTSADTAALISGGSQIPQSAEMDALLKEKPSMDQHDLEANPAGKPEAEGPAGADAKVRKTKHRVQCTTVCLCAWFASLVPFVHDLFISHNLCCIIVMHHISTMDRAEEA